MTKPKKPSKPKEEPVVKPLDGGENPPTNPPTPPKK